MNYFVPLCAPLFIYNHQPNVSFESSTHSWCSLMDLPAFYCHCWCRRCPEIVYLSFVSLSRNPASAKCVPSCREANNSRSPWPFDCFYDERLTEACNVFPSLFFPAVPSRWYIAGVEEWLQRGFICHCHKSVANNQAADSRQHPQRSISVYRANLLKLIKKCSTGRPYSIFFCNYLNAEFFCCSL